MTFSVASWLFSHYSDPQSGAPANEFRPDFRRSLVENTLLIGLENMPDGKVNPDAVSQLSEQELMDLIDTLPDGYRLVFNMYAIEGMSHKEIADQLGIGESTSRSQLVKARKLLQSKVKELQKVYL